MRGKIQDSKKRTRKTAASPAFPGAPMAMAAKITTPVMNAMSTYRGLMNLSRPDAAKRPTAKQPWAPAKRFDAVACEVVGLIQRT